MVTVKIACEREDVSFIIVAVVVLWRPAILKKRSSSFEQVNSCSERPTTCRRLPDWNGLQDEAEGHRIDPWRQLMTSAIEEVRRLLREGTRKPEGYRLMKGEQHQAANGECEA